MSKKAIISVKSQNSIPLELVSSSLNELNVSSMIHDANNSFGVSILKFGRGLYFYKQGKNHDGVTDFVYFRIGLTKNRNIDTIVSDVETGYRLQEYSVLWQNGSKFVRNVMAVSTLDELINWALYKLDVSFVSPGGVFVYNDPDKHVFNDWKNLLGYEGKTHFNKHSHFYNQVLPLIGPLLKYEQLFSHLFPSIDDGHSFKSKFKEEFLEINDNTRPNNSYCYVILAPSATGKSALINQLLSYMSYLKSATKMTTRPQRKGKFKDSSKSINEKKFKKLDSKGKFVYTYEYDGNLYGYKHSEIQAALDSNLDILIDTSQVKVAENIRNAYPNRVKIIYPKSDVATRLYRLYKRYQSENSNYFKDDLDKSKNFRLEDTVNLLEGEKMADIADLVLEDYIFPLKQRELRRYIIQQRNQMVVQR